MKILVVGNGGREHALAWKLANDSTRPELFCAPGNAGTRELGVNLPIEASNINGLVEWAWKNKPELTVVGPEAPLCEGLVDRLAEQGLAAFGPTREAARLEGSKIFAKAVMRDAGVPTAEAAEFEQLDDALAYVARRNEPLVVKADGLAAGKGVTVCATREEAEQALREAMEQGAFGAAGRRVLVEQCLSGEEASILALTDGETVVPLASSQDHKRIGEGDTGPNTGGMGAYSPAPVVTDALWPVIRERVLEPTLSVLRRRGITYRGVLYAGLMIGPDGPKVLEFNGRFGDPETQAILPRWDGDILPALMACAHGGLREDMIRWKPDPCVCVVMASEGYPGSYPQGRPIEGLKDAEAAPGVKVFHAGTAMEDDRVVSAGGRVLGVSATGDNLRAAIESAYAAVTRIRFEGAHYRRDIGFRALRRNAIG